MSPKVDAILQYLQEKDPVFFEIYDNFVSVPCRNNVLDAKSSALINVALSASPTCLCKETLEMHMKSAMAHGATEEEMLEVLKMVSVLGMHTCAVGVPILVEEYENMSGSSKAIELNDEQNRLKEKFMEKMGYWSTFRDVLLDNDIHFFESYYAYLTNPWDSDVLPAKLKEFIYIAIDSSTTHLLASGIRVHIRNAIKYGATFDEIMEVFKLTSSQGSNTFYTSVPMLQMIVAESSAGRE